MRSRAFQATFALFAFTIALFVLAVTAPARATQPGVNGKIAFSFDTTGQIYTINPDGTGLFQLTNVNGAAYSPDWSPDGHRIAFSFDDDTHGGIAIINADGTDFHDLTPTGIHAQPAFTPDGHHLVYECVDCSGGDGIFLMRDDASDFPGLRLTTNPFPGEGDSNPEVSPDGKTVTFVRHQVDGELQALFAVDIDGTNERQVVPYTFEVAIKHDWAPDGGHIALTLYGDSPDRHSPEVATIRPDGSDLRILTRYREGKVVTPVGSYSPDGRWIAFRKRTPGTFGLWVMSPDGGNRKLIANFPFAPRFIDWGPKPANDTRDNSEAATIGNQTALVSEAVISGPNATLSPTSLTFSTQVIGTTSAAKTVTLKNTGTAILTISSIAITGINAGDFAQTHNCGSSLAAGASCSISVRFKPTALGTRTATLSISDNAAGSPQKVPLSGIGTTAKLSPVSLSFSTQAIGTTSPVKTVTLTNVGTTSLTITSIAVTGTNVGDFAQTHTCGSSLAAGASCSISVKFKPTASGTRIAALSITDNAAGSPQKVSLSGTGALGTVVTLAPTSLSFSCFFTCFLFCHWSCTPPQTVSLTDAGSATLYITDITTTGLFSQTNNCGTSLGAKQSCNITVSAHPTNQCGTYTGAVAINDSGTGSPQKVALTEKACP